jgi:hypothetical protein
MGEYQKVLHSELNNILDLIGGGEPPQMSAEEFGEILNKRLSAKAKKQIIKCLEN